MNEIQISLGLNTAVYLHFHKCFQQRHFTHCIYRVPFKNWEQRVELI